MNHYTAKALLRRILFLIAISQSACTGVGGRVELYRIDDRQENTTASYKPVKCLFINCDTENKGS